MTKYFAAANFWLFVSVLAYVGKSAMRSQPDMYAVFGVGRWFEKGDYSTLNTAVLALSILYFILWLVAEIRNRSCATE